MLHWYCVRDLFSFGPYILQTGGVLHKVYFWNRFWKSTFTQSHWKYCNCMKLLLLDAMMPQMCLQLCKRVIATAFALLLSKKKQYMCLGNGCCAKLHYRPLINCIRLHKIAQLPVKGLSIIIIENMFLFYLKVHVLDMIIRTDPKTKYVRSYLSLIYQHNHMVTHILSNHASVYIVIVGILVTLTTLTIQGCVKYTSCLSFKEYLKHYCQKINFNKEYTLLGRKKIPPTNQYIVILFQ